MYFERARAFVSPCEHDGDSNHNQNPSQNGCACDHCGCFFSYDDRRTCDDALFHASDYVCWHECGGDGGG